MGLWKCEVVRIDGELFAYIENQDDWTGSITNGIRKIKLKGDRYEILNMGSRVNLTDKVEQFIRREAEIQTALDWFRKTKF